MTRLTDEQRASLLADYRSMQYPVAALAAKYGVHESYAIQLHKRYPEKNKDGRPKGGRPKAVDDGQPWRAPMVKR